MCLLVTLCSIPEGSSMGRINMELLRKVSQHLWPAHSDRLSHLLGPPSTGVWLVLQRSEHNEGVVSTLRELDLHQQGVERIELLGHACRHLVILFLQANVIGRIENLHRLKVRNNTYFSSFH